MEYIYEIKNNLSPELCSHIIERFEKDDRKVFGNTTAGYTPETNKSTDLRISKLEDWKDIDDILCLKMKECLNKYVYYIQNTLLSHTDINVLDTTFYNMNDTGYQIQRVQKGEYFKWHSDFGSMRHINCIWYLNDMNESAGGRTMFSCGKNIVPETGKMVIFPTCWPYYHCGEEVQDGCKYIITSFILRNEND